MGVLEKEVERKCNTIAKQQGFLLPKWVSPGNIGVPDRLLIGPSARLAFIEFKSASGKLTPAQAYWARKLVELGHEHHVIRDPGAFAALLSGGGG